MGAAVALSVAGTISVAVVGATAAWWSLPNRALQKIQSELNVRAAGFITEQSGAVLDRLIDSRILEYRIKHGPAYRYTRRMRNQARILLGAATALWISVIVIAPHRSWAPLEFSYLAFGLGAAFLLSGICVFVYFSYLEYRLEKIGEAIEIDDPVNHKRLRSALKVARNRSNVVQTVRPPSRRDTGALVRYLAAAGLPSHAVRKLESAIAHDQSDNGEAERWQRVRAWFTWASNSAGIIVSGDALRAAENAFFASR